MAASDVLLLLQLKKKVPQLLTKDVPTGQVGLGTPNNGARGHPVTLMGTTTQRAAQEQSERQAHLAILLLTTAKVCNGHWQGNH